MQKKILIIHLSRLGDMIQSLPAVKLLKEDNTESEITYLSIEDSCVPLRGIPWIDKLLTVPLSDIQGILVEEGDRNVKILDRLFYKHPELTRKYDLLLNLTHSGGSGYIAEQIKAKEKRGRIFSKAGEILMAGNWAKYLFTAARNRNDNLLNLVDLYIGMAGARNRPVDKYLPAHPETDRLCLLQMKEYGINSGRLAIGFQLGASKSQRTWPSEYFSKLGELLGKQLDAQIILFGSESERPLVDQFNKRAPFSFIDLVGRTTLTDLPSFLKYINVLVSNDTGPMHIAAAVGTKVVGIFMGTAFFRITGPYGRGHIAVQSNYPCAPCLDSTVCSLPLCGKHISPESVLEGVKAVLGLEVGTGHFGKGADLYISDFDKNGTMIYEKLTDEKDHFLPWLRSCHDAQAFVSQALWNVWLDLPPAAALSHVGDEDNEVARIARDYRYACNAYSNFYSQGLQTCRMIIAEFCRTKPRLDVIRDGIARVEEIEEGIKNLEGPLAMLKDIHELYSAEMEYCNFPGLAHEFIHKYGRLRNIITGFEKRVNEIRKDHNERLLHLGSQPARLCAQSGLQ